MTTVAEKMEWLSSHPRTWFCWAKKPYPYTAKPVKGPAFERKYIRDLLTGEWEFWVRSE